jgi:SAM-dependent methyltransferase
MTLHPHQYFSDRSDLYARARPTYPAQLFEFLTDQCRETGRAWDCGTGSGQAAIGLAKYFSRIDATDVSREQISNAVANPRVTYTVQPAEKTNFADAAFDLITVAQALHWFDLGQFWPEVHRTLKPGGVFAAWTYTWFRISDRVDAIIERELLEPIQGYWAPQNQLAWNGYRDIAFPFEELAVPEIQMTLAWTPAELLAYIGTWSATRRYVEANGSGFLEVLGAMLRRDWGHPERKTLSMRFHARLGRFVR